MADLISLEEFKLYLGPETKLSTKNDDLMKAAISAASNWVREVTDLDWDQRVYTEDYDGTGLPYLPLRMIPVAVSPMPVVTEDGVALVVAAGFSLTADCVVDPVKGWLFRRTGSTPTGSPNARWSDGFQNVHVVYTAGFAVIPDDIKLLARYVTGRMWHDASRKASGIARRSSGTNSVEFLQTIPDVYKEIVRSNKRVFHAHR